MTSNYKKSVRFDPLYNAMAPPEIFKNRDNPNLSRELLNAIIRINENQNSSLQNPEKAQKIDHAKITEKIDEIEKLLENTKILQPIKSTPNSEINENFSIPVDFCPLEDENIKNSNKAGVNSIFFNMKSCKKIEYKVSLLQNGYKIEKNNENQQKTSGVFEKFKKQIEELKENDKNSYEIINEYLKQRLEFKDWKGKFAPKDHHILEKIFTPNIKMSETTRKSPLRTIPRPLTTAKFDNPLTTFHKKPINFTIGTGKVDKATFYEENFQFKEPAEPTVRQERNFDIYYAQKLKKQLKQNIPLELDKPNICYCANPDRFIQKRFKMNPRFTWLCKTGENKGEWINDIKLGIAHSQKFQRKNMTKGDKRRPPSYYQYYKNKGYDSLSMRPKTALNSMKLKEEKLGLNNQEKKILSKIINFSELSPYKNENLQIEFDQNSQIVRKSPNKDKKLIPTKHKGFINTQYSHKKSISVSFNCEQLIPETQNYNTVRPEKIKRTSTSCSNRVKNQKIKNTEKIIRNNMSNLSKNDEYSSNLTISNLLSLNMKKSGIKLDAEVLNQQKLVRKKRKMYKFYDSKASGNPILDLEDATNINKTYNFLNNNSDIY